MQKRNIVCFGGGTGLSELLKGLKNNPWLDISAIVTMFDSGGSSRILKDRFGVLPPGDISRCVLALTPQEHEVTVRAIFEQRLKDGHTPNNIWLVGAEHIYVDYQTAIDQMCRMYLAKGRVFPVSIEKSNLCAAMHTATVVQGEVEIDKKIREGCDVVRLNLNPEVSANPMALEVIQKADVICIGPGSFYTSLLPNLLPNGVKEALISSKAPIIYILNLMTEGAGMDSYDPIQFVGTLEKYLGRRVDKVISNDTIPTIPREVQEKFTAEGKRPVLAQGSSGLPLVSGSLWLDGSLARHDPKSLSYVIGNLVYELTEK